MARTEAPLSKDEAARAPTRRMTVIAQDPGVQRDNKIVMSTIDVPAEDLRVGPMGYRVQVADYDATRRVFHGSHNLPASIEKEPKAWQDGDPSILRDFRFHAQNAYALVMKTLARFEFALGRRIPWSFEHPSAESRAARHGRRQCLLQSRGRRTGVRILHGDIRRPGVHVPFPRHHRSRDDARAPRCAA